jgi:hypothetical protein
LPAAGCLAVLLLGAAPAGAQTTTVYRTVTPEQLEKILTDLKIAFKKSQRAGFPDDFHYDFDRNKYPYRFTLSRGKLLWLSVSFPKATLEQINGWNIQAKFSRAVLDRTAERDTTFVESQLDADGGVTPEIIRQFLYRFDAEVPRFDDYLKNN